jgi:nitroreductase
MNDIAVVSADALPSLEVERVIHARRSALAFSDREVDDAMLARLFEAARWSASSSNEQPWRFVVTTRRDREAFDRLLSTLAPGNAAWAANAPVLVLTAARRDFEARPRPNRHAGYDLGQSVATMSLLAVSLGLVLHQMGGFDADQAGERLGVPAEFELFSVIAIGYPGDALSLPEPQRARASAARTRRPLASLAWSGRWGETATFASAAADDSTRPG